MPAAAASPRATFSEPQFITIGDSYSDAYSGERKVPQESSEGKDPFAHGMKAASRHRGRQFLTAHEKQGQTHRSMSTFVTAAAGDPFQDRWKFQQNIGQHRQRQNMRGASAAAAAAPRRRGIVAGAPRGPLTMTNAAHPHMADYGYTVAVPTRKAETYSSYVPENQTERRAESASPAQRPRAAPSTRKTRVRLRRADMVDHYALQEKLRSQMVMGMGSGCRGASPSLSPRRQPPPQQPRSFRATQRSSRLFDAYVRGTAANTVAWCGLAQPSSHPLTDGCYPP
jgi:hypothetical protein